MRNYVQSYSFVLISPVGTYRQRLAQPIVRQLAHVINPLQTTLLHPAAVSMRVIFVLRSAEAFAVFLRFVLPDFERLMTNASLKYESLGWESQVL